MWRRTGVSSSSTSNLEIEMEGKLLLVGALGKNEDIEENHGFVTGNSTLTSAL